MNGLSRGLDRACFSLGCLSVSLIFFFTIAEVILRLFGVSLVWVNDLQGFLMVAAVFLALGDVTRRREHLVADFFTALMPVRVRNVLDMVCYLGFSVVYVLLLMWIVGALAFDSYADGVRSEGILRVPLVLPQALIVAGLAVMLLALLVRLRSHFFNATANEEGPGAS